jgi:hypothetical protein
MRIGIGFGGQPFIDVGNLARRIVQAAIEQTFGGGFAFCGIEHASGRVQDAEAAEHRPC